MKHGFLKGRKVAECQDGQAQLMARFLRDGVVDEWRGGETPAPETAAAGAKPEALKARETPSHQPEAQETGAFGGAETAETPETQTGTQTADGAAKPGDGETPPAPETARAENTEAKPNGKTKPGKRVG
jgi:hypothetical protein